MELGGQGGYTSHSGPACLSVRVAMLRVRDIGPATTL